jgi:hypothetical protein
MPAHVFDRMLATGLLPAPDPDGTWPATEVARFDAVLALAPRARSLERRVLLLHLSGFLPSLAARRAAALSLVDTIRPAARKMARVRQELDALAERARLGGPRLRRPRTYALPLAREQWRVVLEAANDELWQAEWQLAARYASILASIAQAEGLPDVDLPEEERLVLVLVTQLLRHPEVRRQVPLGEPVPRLPETRRTHAPVSGRYGPAGDPFDR